jgi:hypothetical protein
MRSFQATKSGAEFPGSSLVLLPFGHLAIVGLN